MQVLMVDDEADIRFVTKLMLDGQGHDVSEAGSVKEAIASLEESIPDVILLDIRLPDGEGFEVIQQVRADARFESVRIVMLSAHSSPEALAEAATRGSDGYLVKPFTEPQLIEALSSYRDQVPSPERPSPEAKA